MIEEKNLFTATELATLIPLYNGKMYKELMNDNDWLHQFFPNYKPRQISTAILYQSSWKRNCLEKILSLFGNILDKSLMKITLNRWQKIYSKGCTESDFKIVFKTNATTSKSHPKNYQRKVIDLYNQKLKEFNNTHDLQIQS